MYIGIAEALHCIVCSCILYCMPLFLSSGRLSIDMIYLSFQINKPVTRIHLLLNYRRAFYINGREKYLIDPLVIVQWAFTPFNCQQKEQFTAVMSLHSLVLVVLMCHLCLRVVGNLQLTFIHIEGHLKYGRVFYCTRFVAYCQPFTTRANHTLSNTICLASFCFPEKLSLLIYCSFHLHKSYHRFTRRGFLPTPSAAGAD